MSDVWFDIASPTEVLLTVSVQQEPMGGNEVDYFEVGVYGPIPNTLDERIYFRFEGSGSESFSESVLLEPGRYRIESELRGDYNEAGAVAFAQAVVGIAHVTDAPALSTWGLALLGLLMIGTAWRNLQVRWTTAWS